ncbi:MAG TPA: spore coat U domain-containing protein [Burkholderiaceae bacterium]
MKIRSGALLPLALAIAWAVLAWRPAHATTATGTFQVNATVVSACTVSGTTLSFGGAINPLSTGVPLDASSSLSVQCTNTTPYAVALNAGTHAGGPANFTARAMASGSNSLGYQLYLDSGRSSVWGDGTGSSATSSGTGTGSTQTIPIYGRIPSLSGIVPGTYTDTVTVTVTY